MATTEKDIETVNTWNRVYEALHVLTMCISGFANVNSNSKFVAVFLGSFGVLHCLKILGDQMVNCGYARTNCCPQWALDGAAERMPKLQEKLFTKKHHVHGGKAAPTRIRCIGQIFAFFAIFEQLAVTGTAIGLAVYNHNQK